MKNVLITFVQYIQTLVMKNVLIKKELKKKALINFVFNPKRNHPLSKEILKKRDKPLYKNFTIVG